MFNNMPRDRFEVFSALRARHARSKKTKKPAAFFKRHGPLNAVRQSWRKNGPHNGRSGVAADLSIAVA
jgi:hypothetical protein